MTVLQKLKQKKRKLELKEQAINEFKPLYTKLKSSVKEKALSNNILLVKNLIADIGKKIDTSGIIKVLEKQSKKLDNKDLIAGIRKMINKLTVLEKKTYFDVKEFNAIFQEGLGEVLNAVVSQNQIPDSTKYTRNAKRKIRTVFETYSSFTLKHTWNYDRQGNLSSVKTVKNEIK